MLCNFTVVMAYSILSPLVTPFGEHFSLLVLPMQCDVRRLEFDLTTGTLGTNALTSQLPSHLPQGAD